MEFVPSAELLTFEELENIVRVFAKFGVKRVRITGGEPLVRRQATSLISRISKIEGIEEVLMTTNGHLLEALAPQLVEAGLTGINVSIDSLDPNRFRRITRGGDVARVIRGIQAIKKAGIASLKLNTVAIDGFNQDELINLVQFASAEGATLRFIEFMPVGQDTIWEGGRCLPAASIRETLSTRWQLESTGFIAGKGPARYWTVSGEGLKDGKTSVGIIAAVTECFCDSCNRVRLTSTGGLRACLANDQEINLKDVLRSGGSETELVEAIRVALFGKHKTHDFSLTEGNGTQKQMSRIGG